MIINTVKLTLSFLAVILSLIWMINENGYEPKIVFVTMLLGFITFYVKYTEKSNLFESFKKSNKNETETKSFPSHIEISITIKKYDKFYYKARKYYFDFFMVILLVALSYALIQNNKKIVGNYERFLKGEVVENFSEDFIYKKNGNLKTLGEFRVERNQIVAIIVVALLFFFVIFIKPSVLSLISKMLRKKLKFVYLLDNFEEYSIKTNEHLKSYQFLTEEILL